MVDLCGEKKKKPGHTLSLNSAFLGLKQSQPVLCFRFLWGAAESFGISKTCTLFWVVKGLDSVKQCVDLLF